MDELLHHGVKGAALVEFDGALVILDGASDGDGVAHGQILSASPLRR